MLIFLSLVDNLLPSIHTEKPYGGSRNTDAESIHSRRPNSPSRRRSASMDRSHSATRTRDPSERGRATEKITEKPLERTTHGRAATLDRTLSERTSILDRTGERDRTYNTHMVCILSYCIPVTLTKVYHTNGVSIWNHYKLAAPFFNNDNKFFI